jgi:hypothetical protein
MRPPFLVKIERTLGTVRFLLSVRQVTMMATPPGPYPS